MKQYLFPFLFAALLLLPTSCFNSNLEGDDPDFDLGDLMIVLSNGEEDNGANLQFTSFNYYPHPSDVPGCGQVIASTGMRTGGIYTDYLTLSFCFYDETAIGQELKLERVMFCMPFSSDSRDYANSFSGKMILKSRTETKVVIGMENVCFSIKHGVYTLNGDLVAEKK